MDPRLDHCRGHSGFQQPVKFDCMCFCLLQQLRYANLGQTALFASWFTYGLSGIFWLFMNKGLYFSSPRKIALTILNLFIVGIGGCLVC